MNTAKAKPRLTLLHKGFLIVGIPFVCQLFVIGLLLREVQKSEAESVAEARAKEIVDQTQRVTEACYGVVFAAWNCRISSKENTDNLVAALGTLPAARDDLQKTMNTSPTETADYKKISGSLDKLASEFTQWRDVVADGTLLDKTRLMVAFDNQKVRRALTTQLERVAHGLNDINRRSDNIRVNSPARQMSVQNDMQWISLFGGVGTVALGILLVMFLSRNITSRLRVLEDNSVKLAAGAPLNAPLTGNDEISEVDSVFHHMAQMLKETRAKEAALINNANEVICSIDEEGNFVRLNPACLHQWGYAPEELNSHSLRAVVDDRCAADTIAALDSARRGTPNISFESVIRRKDGSFVDVLWSVYWSEVEQLLFCVVYDITERKQAEQLRQDFFAMVSHDLKAPLSSVMVAHEMVIAGIYGEIAPAAESKLESAHKNLGRLVKLVNDLLDLEKLEAGKMEIEKQPVSTARLIEQAMSAVEDLASQHAVTLVPVRVEVEVADITIDVDEDRMDQVLINLLTHAIKTSPSGSEVRLSFKQVGAFVEFEITDGGPAVPLEHRTSIFERFNPLHPNAPQRRDTSLGLAICKLIIESHGGAIAVEPLSASHASGNKFSLRVPASSLVGAR